MIHLRADPATVADVNKLFDHIGNGFRRLGNGEKRMIRESILRGFQRNFTMQQSGSGQPWRPLAAVTQAERRRKGYAGARPILVRTGQYRDALVNSRSAAHYSATGNLIAGIYLEEGAEGRLVTYHEGGTSKMPARPATILSGASRDELGRVIDGVMRRAESRQGV